MLPFSRVRQDGPRVHALSLDEWIEAAQQYVLVRSYSGTGAVLECRTEIVGIPEGVDLSQIVVRVTVERKGEV